MSIVAQVRSLPHGQRKLEEIRIVLRAVRAVGCRALAEGCVLSLPKAFEEAMSPLLSDGPQVRQRTNPPRRKRMAREFRRFLRPREALRSSRHGESPQATATAPALVALALAQINARHRKEDWLPVFLGAAVGLPQRLTEFRIPLHT